MQEIDRNRMCDCIFLALAVRTDLPRDNKAKIHKLQRLYESVYQATLEDKISAEPVFKRMFDEQQAKFRQELRP